MTQFLYEGSFGEISGLAETFLTLLANKPHTTLLLFRGEVGSSHIVGLCGL